MKLELCSPTERDSELGHHIAVRASKNNGQQGIRVSQKNPADCRNFPIAMASLIPSPVLNTPLEAMVKSRDFPHHWHYLGFFWVTGFLGLTIHIVLKKALSFTGWWFGTCLFSPIVGMMIQSDFHIFQGGRYTTNQIYSQPSKTIIINHHH